MIAIAQQAAPATSLFEVLAASELPAAGPNTAAGSPFHSMLQAVTDADERTTTPPITLNIFRGGHTPDKNDGETKDAGVRPKIKPAKKDSTADSVPAATDPVPPRQTTTLPIALNIFVWGDAQDKSDGKNTEPPSTTGDKSVPGKIAEASAQLRTALWVAPRIQLEEQSAPETQPDPDRQLAVDASAAGGSLSKLAPAFEARLQPVAPQESLEPAEAAAASNKPETKDTLPEPAAATAQEDSPSVAQAAPSSSRQGDSSRHPAQERPQEAAIATARPDASAEMAQNNFDGNAPMPPVASTASATHASSRSEAPAEAAPPTPIPQPPAVAPAAHDIKLELNGGGQRVEVRLTERGGDIHVAVRTPDARLSDAMREDLPALAAKLEQSGFRTDAWQPAAAGSERRAVETGTGNASQDSQEHAGQNQQQKQDDPQQPHPRNLTNAPNRKSDRKDFAWLLQTYR